MFYADCTVFFQTDLVISQSIYVCTVRLQLLYNQSTCCLKLFYCLLTEFRLFHTYFTLNFSFVFFTVVWTGRAGQGGPGGSGAESGGSRVVGSFYSYFKVIQKYVYSYLDRTGRAGLGGRVGGRVRRVAGRTPGQAGRGAQVARPAAPSPRSLSF